jgi:hypothetical protein
MGELAAWILGLLLVSLGQNLSLLSPELLSSVA